MQKAKERGIVLSQPQQPEADCPNSQAPASDAAGQKSHPTQVSSPGPSLNPKLRSLSPEILKNRLSFQIYSEK